MSLAYLFAGDTGQVRLSDKGVNHDAVLLHPYQLAALDIFAGLIGQLRACGNVKDGQGFQQAAWKPGWLSTTFCERLGRQYPCIGEVKPDARHRNAAQERRIKAAELALQRQDRCQAWRVFSFQRRYIPALSRNNPPGSMARKAGLAREQEYFEKAWREDGRLALMHDLRPA
jgi:hypothetical protein